VQNKVSAEVASLSGALEGSIRHLLSRQDPSDGGFIGVTNILKPVRRGDEHFIFTEITAYSVELLLRLHEWDSSKGFIDAAVRAADSCLKYQYLGQVDAARGGFYDRFYLGSRRLHPYLYAYPNAVVVAALADAFAFTGLRKYLDAALLGVDWLLDVMFYSDGVNSGFRDSLPLDVGAPSNTLYPYEAICIPVMLLTREDTLGPFLEEQRSRLWDSIKWGLAVQHDDGTFPTLYSLTLKRMQHRVYTHFSLYPLYNLMNFPLHDLSTTLHHPSAAENERRALDWTARAGGEDGGYFAFYSGRGGKEPKPLCNFRQTPATAQAANALILRFKQTADEGSRALAFKSLTWLMSQMLRSGPYRGALPWIVPEPRRSASVRRLLYLLSRWSLMRNRCDVMSVDFDGKATTWATQFFVDALLRVL